MLSRDMFTRAKIESALRNNVDYITLILSFISSVLFLNCNFLAHVGSINWVRIYMSYSVFAAVGYFSSQAAAISVFLVLFIVIDFALLIASLGFLLVRVLTELEVFSDKLEVKLATLPLSPAKIISLTGVFITFVSMIMGCVCAASGMAGNGYYTVMFVPFIFFALSALSAFIIPFIVGKSYRYSAHRDVKAQPAHEEYTEQHGWGGTDNFNDNN